MIPETTKKIYFTAKEVMDMFGFRPNIHGKYHISDLTDKPIKIKPFDRNAYMKEYMRKRRKNFVIEVKKNLQKR